MITMIKTVASTPSDFFRSECAIHGEDEVFAWIDAGWSIVSDGDNGFKWAKEVLTTAPISARVRPSHTNGT